ncbi:protein pinocchio [Cylas formicarius]|uniref:protein pinocchio n=1 Tax=Cylas formicarius TaxID=197179 RepID=UPI002958A58E|nr:protein pinocchio [Cylas formicarius]
MLRVESNTSIVGGFTEYEEEILFDSDDPDFDHTVSLHNIVFRSETRFDLSTGGAVVSSDMSLAGVHHPADLHSSRGSLITMSHSLDDITNWGCSPPTAFHSDHVLTIEELRDQMNCCFTCGVSWADSHVSLDCSECGGYALDRPCPECDGGCGGVWKRDLSSSHASGKAKWIGECQGHNQQPKRDASFSVGQDLTQRFERLSATS